MDTTETMLPEDDILMVPPDPVPAKREPSMHISIGDDIRAILKPFARNRRKSMSEVIRYALEKLFEEERVEPQKEAILGRLVARRFAIPRGYKLRSFWLTLYMLAAKYPEASSRNFWGGLVYLGEQDMSHSDVVAAINSELKREQE